MNENIYSNKILLELDKLEKFSTKYKAELRLLSKKIRKDFWNNNDANLLKLLVLVNGVVNKKYLDRDVCTFELLQDYIDTLKMFGAIYVPNLKPDLTEYLETNKAERTSFLKYKVLIEKAEGKRRWYEPTFDERFKKFFEGKNWDEVSSNLEKLPYFAREMKKHTPRAKIHQADASELFTFAKPGWEKKLDPKILDYVGRVISDYEECLKRIRTRRHAASKIKAKHNDINRILYMQNKENNYEADELAAVFINLPEERVNEIYFAVRNENWHFMKEDERYAFLIKHLPEAEYREYYDIFADFRFGGYKLLPDIITETRNYNISANASAMQYPNDSEELTLMVKTYLRNPVGNYRETVSKEAARIIETHVISFNASVKYIVALGKRDFLYDAYYRHIIRFARKGDKRND